MLKIFLSLLILAPSVTSAVGDNLNHHGRWVTAALLAEIVTQEAATMAQLGLDSPQQLPAQIAFVQDLGNRIKYEPTQPQPTVSVSLGEQSTAIATLPHWPEWQYLSQTSTKLRPICQSTARSPHCLAFLALQSKTSDQLVAIQQLNQLAREQPKQYADDNTKAYHALLLLRQKNFPETLRVLFDMQKTDVKFRLIYDKAQRIFSLTQKAEGDVVLRQAL